MSFKAKNLSYESQQPAFLRRLRGEASGQDPARHERAIARPRKPKNPNDEDDDGPTYVDEDNNDVFTKSEYEAMVNHEKETPERQDVPQQSDRPSGEQAGIATGISVQESTSKEQVAHVGGSNKRRLAKVVGDEEEESNQPAPNETKALSKPKSRPKKGKKIKLSFDEDAGSAEN